MSGLCIPERLQVSTWTHPFSICGIQGQSPDRQSTVSTIREHRAWE